MNQPHRSRSHAAASAATRSRGRQAARMGVLLATLLLLVACGRRDNEPTPTAQPAAESPLATPVLATDTPVQPDSPLTAPEDPDAPESDAQAPAPTSDAVTVTVDANGTTAVFTPLEVDEGMACDIESHIDLAGYPDLEQVLGCPTGEATTNPVALNEFGEGPDYDRFMLWFSDSRDIYILYPDGTWTSEPDTWEEGDPTFSCNPLEGEADSPPLPRRGFGKVWCSDPDIQDALGFIPREERLCQHSVTQPFADGRLLACFEDATIRYFRILDDSTWDVVVQ